MLAWACILYLGLLVTGRHAEEQSGELKVEIDRSIPRHHIRLSDDETFITRSIPRHHIRLSDDETPITTDYATRNIHEPSVTFREMASLTIFKRNALGQSTNGELDGNVAKETRRIKRDLRIEDTPLHISDYTTDIRFKTIHAIYAIRTRTRRSQKVDINNPQTQMELEVGYSYAGNTVQIVYVHSARRKRGNVDE